MSHRFLPAVISLVALVVVGCGAGPVPSGTLSAASTDENALAPLIRELRATGATVTDLGAFNPDPLGGEGVALCVAGERVSVHVYESAEEQEAAASQIDRNDPSHVGTMIVEWAGNPTFWQHDRLIVLYLGSNPGVKTVLTSVLGDPFAAGLGRDRGAGAHSC